MTRFRTGRREPVMDLINLMGIFSPVIVGLLVLLLR
ncbi:hypothetical protein HNQ79_005917 [Streptomyces candidus]|uniref:Uncharacterized protein n=1 Tax=Streptomyces candidus TaxID=67283 RepID=A0A7X0HKL5_9ACTN|nr:hypothetical protein [Streptomyces candidus]